MVPSSIHIDTVEDQKSTQLGTRGCVDFWILQILGHIIKIKLCTLKAEKGQNKMNY